MFPSLVFSFGVGLAFSSLVFAAPTAPQSFSSCLQSLTDLELVLPGSSKYSNASAAFNRRFTYRPAAIVYPETPQAVSQAVKCAALSNVTVSARSGGHSYAAFGLGGHDGALIVDLSPLKSITVDNQGNAVSQSGNTLGTLAKSIYAQGKRALPHGTCPYVGTGGHASYGGFGPYSRKAGLLLDRIKAAQVVLANGTIVTASASSNPDLFWALRGAAPSYGIVTAWTFATLPAPSSTINFQINFPKLTEAQITSAMSGFQAWVSRSVPDELGLTVVHGPDGDGGIYMSFMGSYYGSKAGLDGSIAGLLAVLPKSQKVSTKTFTNWISGLEDTDGSLDTSKPDEHDTFFAKSLMTTAPVSNSTWKNWVHYLHTSGLQTNPNWFSEIDLYGGVISRIAKDATAYVNRDAILTFQLYASSPNFEPPYPSSSIPFVNGMLNALTSSPKAAYPNYVDPTLTTSEWHSQYFGTNYARLSSIRKQYDPHRVFAFPQSIN